MRNELASATQREPSSGRSAIGEARKAGARVKAGAAVGDEFRRTAGDHSNFKSEDRDHRGDVSHMHAITVR
jgi:hypothetical protein